jgi:hypothetical protein
MSQSEIEQTRLAQNCVKLGGHAQRVQAELARVSDAHALADMNEALPESRDLVSVPTSDAAASLARAKRLRRSEADHPVFLAP